MILMFLANEQKIGGEMCWVMRRNFRIPSEEEMRRLVTPENVCIMFVCLHQLFVKQNDPSAFCLNLMIECSFFRFVHMRACKLDCIILNAWAYTN